MIIDIISSVARFAISSLFKCFLHLLAPSDGNVLKRHLAFLNHPYVDCYHVLFLRDECCQFHECRIIFRESFLQDVLCRFLPENDVCAVCLFPEVAERHSVHGISVDVSEVAVPELLFSDVLLCDVVVAVECGFDFLPVFEIDRSFFHLGSFPKSSL